MSAQKELRELKVDVGSLRTVFEGTNASRAPVSFSVKRLGLGIERGNLGEFYAVRKSTAASSGAGGQAAAQAPGQQGRAGGAGVGGAAQAAPPASSKASGASARAPVSGPAFASAPASASAASVPASTVPERETATAVATKAAARQEADEDEEEEVPLPAPPTPVSATRDDAPSSGADAEAVSAVAVCVSVPEPEVAPRPTLKLPAQAVVIFSHRPQEAGELAAAVGEVVLVMDVNDEGWCLAASAADDGEDDDDPISSLRVGWLPLDYVDLDVDGYRSLQRSAAVSMGLSESGGGDVVQAPAAASASLASRPAAPLRGLREARQAVLDELASSGIFNDLRAERTVEVTGADVDLVILAAGGTDDARLLIRSLDAAGRRLKSFDELAAALAELRPGLVELHTALRSLLAPGGAGLGLLVAPDGPWGGDPDAAAWHLLRSSPLAASQTVAVLRDRGSSGVSGASAGAAMESALALLASARASSEEAERAARARVLDELMDPSCKLFGPSQVLSVNVLDVDRLYSDGRTGDWVLAGLRELADAGASFASFTELVDRLTGTVTEPEVARLRSASDVPPAFAAVMDLLTSPGCRLLRGGARGAVRVSAADTDRLLALRPDRPGLLLQELRCLDGLGTACGSMADVVEEVESGTRLRVFKGGVAMALRRAAPVLLDPGAAAPLLEAGPAGDEAVASAADLLLEEGLAAERTGRMLRAMASGIVSPPLASVRLLAGELCRRFAALEARFADEEKDEALDALTSEPLFSADVDITLPDLRDVVLSGTVSVWGLTGGHVGPLLHALVQQGREFPGLPDLARGLESLDRLDQRFTAGSTQ